MKKGRKKHSNNKTLLLVLFLLIALLSSLLFLNYNNYINHKKIEDLAMRQNDTIDQLNSYQDTIDLLQGEIDSSYDKGTYSIDKLKEIDLSNIDYLMISTHPDDEMFWGGAHLIEDNYLVVCVTCGMDADRQADFERVMNITQDKYVELVYPRVVDPSLEREFNWNAAAYLTQDLINVINLKDWKMIVTHNPEGEYGHKYHILTSQIVTSIVKNKDILYYFGKYYDAYNTSKLSSDKLSDELYNKKCEIIDGNYQSQYGSIRINRHMFKNENFVKYSDWQ